MFIPKFTSILTRSPNSAFLIYISLLITPITAQVSFTGYPSASIPCLNAAFTSSGCPSIGTTAYINACLCNNIGGFIGKTAQCVGTHDPDDLPAVYDTMSYACDLTGTPLQGTYADFLEVAGVNTNIPSSTSAVSSQAQVTSGSAGSTTIVDAPSEATAPSGGSGGNSGGNGGVGKLSGGTIALISCVAGVGSLVIAILGICWCKHRG
jgi:hypothetical protein